MIWFLFVAYCIFVSLILWKFFSDGLATIILVALFAGIFAGLAVFDLLPSMNFFVAILKMLFIGVPYAVATYVTLSFFNHMWEKVDWSSIGSRARYVLAVLLGLAAIVFLPYVVFFVL